MNTFIRRFFQITFIIVVAVLTSRNLLGFTKAHVETYCPAGGLESIIFYVKNRAFLCATSGINLIMFIFIVVGTIIIGRAFCSWVCPVGTLMEFISAIGKKAKFPQDGIWKGKLGYLRFIKIITLVAVLYFTHQHLDLVFRPFCPYYVGFSGQDHEVEWWSKWFLAVTLFLTLFLPFVWCKVLCPFGGFLSIVKKISPLSPAITTIESCTSCGICEQACPQQISIIQEKRVSSGECTQCLNCLDKCPKKCISLHFGYSAPISENAESKKIFTLFSPIVIPIGVALMMIGGVIFAFTFPMPTLSKQFSGYQGSNVTSSTTMIIKGLRCRGTANNLGRILEKDKGVLSFEAYVGEQKAIILFDSNLTSVEKIKTSIDNGLEITDRTGNTRLVRPFTVEKVISK